MREKQAFRVSLFWEETGTLAEGTMEDVRDVVLVRKPDQNEMDVIEYAAAVSAAKLGLVSRRELSDVVDSLKVLERRHRKNKNRALYWLIMMLFAEGMRALGTMEVEGSGKRSKKRKS